MIPPTPIAHFVSSCALLGFGVMFHSYDYIPLFVPSFDIPVSLDNLFQRIVCIYGETSTLSCLRHFHACQTTSPVNTGYTNAKNMS